MEIFIDKFNAMGAQTKIVKKIIDKKRKHVISSHRSQILTILPVRFGRIGGLKTVCTGILMSHSERIVREFATKTPFACGLCYGNSLLEHLKKQATGDVSLKTLRRLAGWDISFLERVAFAEVN